MEMIGPFVVLAKKEVRDGVAALVVLPFIPVINKE